MVITINNSTLADIDEIFRLYRMASDYQKSKKKVIVWPDFSKAMVEKEIKENHQWKIIIDDKIACVWATTFTDPQIWEQKDQDPAIYIHRIATHSDYRGHNFVGKIVDWAKQYASSMGKQYIRLDTIGNNTTLIEHYKKAGFTFLGLFDLENTEGLPVHYSQGPACLFEIHID